MILFKVANRYITTYYLHAYLHYLFLFIKKLYRICQVLYLLGQNVTIIVIEFGIDKKKLLKIETLFAEVIEKEAIHAVVEVNDHGFKISNDQML